MVSGYFSPGLLLPLVPLAGCETLYSEDLQHNHLIEDRLRVTNPFAG
jgi:predicted nucleic acid-binding protein